MLKVCAEGAAAPPAGEEQQLQNNANFTLEICFQTVHKTVKKSKLDIIGHLK